MKKLKKKLNKLVVVKDDNKTTKVTFEEKDGIKTSYCNC